MIILESMSKLGNCWDNAPMGSFFVHMKDEVKVVKNYANYYGNIPNQ